MKRLLYLFLIIAAAAAILTACGSSEHHPDRMDTGNVKHITIAYDGDAKPKYDIVMRKGVLELVDMNNTMRLSETDGIKAEELSADKTYYFKFYDYDGKLLAAYAVSTSGYLLQDGADNACKLTTEFDAAMVEDVIEKYKDKKITG